jgi:hypothetical protein
MKVDILISWKWNHCGREALLSDDKDGFEQPRLWRARQQLEI